MTLDFFCDACTNHVQVIVPITVAVEQVTAWCCHRHPRPRLMQRAIKSGAIFVRPSDAPQP